MKHTIDILKSDTLINYESSFTFQKNYVNEIINQESNELIWFLEHDHVYTAGSGIKSDELKISINNVPVSSVNRGGEYTYHGPGQLVVYLMLDLKKIFYPHEPDIKKYVEFLELWMIESLTSIGIKDLTQNTAGHGVWYKNKKIAAIGIHIKKWIAYHGIAININTDLNYYNYITPCGLSNAFSTSSIQDLGYCNITRANLEDALLSELLKSRMNIQYATIKEISHIT